MKLSGNGGTLKLAGTLVARILAWNAEGDGGPGGYLGQARITDINTYYINHHEGFKLRLQLGNSALVGTCAGTALEGNTLHFHIRRDKGGER